MNMHTKEALINMEIRFRNKVNAAREALAIFEENEKQSRTPELERQRIYHTRGKLEAATECYNELERWLDLFYEEQEDCDHPGAA